MDTNPWLPFTIGSVVTLGSVLMFLYSMWLGLNHRRWWPLAVVVSAWVVLMAAWSFHDSGSTAPGSRKRIQSDTAGHGTSGWPAVHVAGKSSGRLPLPVSPDPGGDRTSQETNA